MSKTKRVPSSANTGRTNHKSVRQAFHAVDDQPSWRFSTVDKAGPFAWPSGKPIEGEIIAKLAQFDSMRWATIVGKQHHQLSLDRLSKSALERLQEIGQDDVDELFSFHFAGRQRIIGIRQRAVLKLLWWDPEHMVCPSTLKHT